MTGESQDHPPPDFCGGILADAMGLGKTLTVIALITSGFKEDERHEEQYISGSIDAGSRVKTTLLIVPLSRRSLSYAKVIFG